MHLNKFWNKVLQVKLLEATYIQCYKNGLEGGCMVQNSGKINTFLICGNFAGVNECIFLKFASFWVGFGRFSGLKSRIIVWSQKFTSFWVWECLKFIFFVGFVVSSLPGIMNWNGCAEFHSLLLLERCEIHGEKYTWKFGQFGQFWSASQTHWRSNLVHSKGYWSESALWKCYSFS